MVLQHDIYEAVLEELRRMGADVVRSGYYPQIMGNFIISFRLGGRAMSLVNERLELFLCGELGGEGDRRSLRHDMRQITTDEIQTIVRRALRES
jgi:hypothetical protein